MNLPRNLVENCDFDGKSQFQLDRLVRTLNVGIEAMLNHHSEIQRFRLSVCWMLRVHLSSFIPTIDTIV